MFRITFTNRTTVFRCNSDNLVWHFAESSSVTGDWVGMKQTCATWLSSVRSKFGFSGRSEKSASFTDRFLLDKFNDSKSLLSSEHKLWQQWHRHLLLAVHHISSSLRCVDDYKALGGVNAKFTLFIISFFLIKVFMFSSRGYVTHCFYCSFS